MGPSFVIRLAADASRIGKLVGEVEDVSSRRVELFRDADELVALLERRNEESTEGQ